MPARLSIVTLGARNMGTLRSFYRALGWPELPSGDDTWTGFLLGGVRQALFPVSDQSAEAAPDSPLPTGWSGVTLACAVDTREEVDSTFAAAVAAGALRSPPLPIGRGAGDPRSSPTRKVLLVPALGVVDITGAHPARWHAQRVQQLVS